jgi:hypothetical protein
MATGLHQKPLTISRENQWLMDLCTLDGTGKCHLITLPLSHLYWPTLLTLTLKMEAAYMYETLATPPTFRQCKDPKVESVS